MPRLRLPEVVIPGRRLGRNLNHDVRSLRYVVREAATPVVAEHDETMGLLDQGNLGSCTGNAFTHMLGTAEFTVDAKWLPLAEPFAVQRYSRATQVDPWDGAYPPQDTGSDGLSVCKAGQQDGFVSGYTHATSIAGCYTMIADRAFIIGVSWYEGMDDPDVHGNVEVSGQIRGGHEICVVARQADGRWRVKNSWGSRWADQGYFYLTDEQLVRLLAEEGDATQAVPITAPAPVPTPQPETGFPWADVEPWLDSPHWWKRATVAAKAVKAWKAGQSL